MNTEKAVYFRCGICGRLYGLKADADRCCSEDGQIREAKLNGELCAGCEKPLTAEDYHGKGVIHIEHIRHSAHLDEPDELREGYFHADCLLNTKWEDIRSRLIPN